MRTKRKETNKTKEAFDLPGHRRINVALSCLRGVLLEPLP